MITLELLLRYLALIFSVPALADWFQGPKQSKARGLTLLALVALSFWLVQQPTPLSYKIIAPSLFLIFSLTFGPLFVEKRILAKMKMPGDFWEASKLPTLHSFLCLEGNKNLYLALQQLHHFLKTRQDEKALALIHQLENEQKDRAALYSEIMDLYRITRRYEDGILFFEANIEKIGIHATEMLLLTLCRLYAEIGQFRKAHHCLKQLESLPHAEFINLHIVIGYMVFYALAGAKERFTQLLIENPFLSDISNFSHWKGVLLYRSGEQEAGKKLLDEEQELQKKLKQHSLGHEIERYLVEPNQSNSEIQFAQNVQWVKQEQNLFNYNHGFKIETWSWFLILTLFSVFIFLYINPLTNFDFINIGALTPFSLQEEHFRLLSSGFLHANWLHLFSNILGLFFLGRAIETILNRYHLSLIMIFSILAGNIISLIFIPNVISVGASGGICGLVGALLIYHFSLHKKLPPKMFKRFLLTFSIVIGLNIHMSLSIAQINNWAHLGGFLGGAITSFFLIQIYKKEKKPKRNTIFFGGFLFLIFVWMLIGWINLFQNPYPKKISLEKEQIVTAEGLRFKIPATWKFIADKDGNRFKIPKFDYFFFWNTDFFKPSRLTISSELELGAPKKILNGEWEVIIISQKNLPSLKMLYFTRRFKFKRCNLWLRVVNPKIYPIEEMQQWITPLLKNISTVD